MKTALLIIASLALSGCMSHKLPPDAYMRGVKSEIVTPWGSHKLDIQEAGTGTAAANASQYK
jgi:hypothetical protein